MHFRVVDKTSWKNCTFWVSERMGADARQRIVEQFSTPQVVDGYQILFAECTGSGR
jgi:hypothetical protein